MSPPTITLSTPSLPHTSQVAHPHSLTGRVLSLLISLRHIIGAGIKGEARLHTLTPSHPHTLTPSHPPILPSCRLPPSAEAQLQMMYRRSVHTSTDPFKRALHCVLARCALQDNHTEVCAKTDDYMWLKVGPEGVWHWGCGSRWAEVGGA